MNKTEFCAKMAERITEATGKFMSKAECLRQYDNVMGCLYDFVSEGEEVNIFGLLRFEMPVVPERVGRNPATGEPMTIPAHKALKVKASKTLKEAVKALPLD